MGWSPSVAAAATSPALAPPSAASMRSASVARTGVSATPNSAIAPPETAAPATAKSAWRRLNSTIAWPLPPPSAGTRTSVTSSPGRLAVMSAPVKNSPAGTRRSPSGPRSTISPSSARTTAGSSAAGSAWTTLPTTVPRWRTGGWATWPRASVMSGAARATSSERSTADCRVRAPIASQPSSRRM